MSGLNTGLRILWFITHVRTIVFLQNYYDRGQHNCSPRHSEVDDTATTGEPQEYTNYYLNNKYYLIIITFIVDEFNV